MKAYLVPGKSEEKALIYGGIHAKEKAAKEIGELTVESLRNAPERPEFATIVIPDIFGGVDRTVNGRDLGELELDPNKSFPQEGLRLDQAPQTEKVNHWMLDLLIRISPDLSQFHRKSKHSYESESSTTLNAYFNFMES